MIQALEASPTTNAGTAVWEPLWTRVHHQGDVCEASYAVVPHIVRIALARNAQCSWEYLAFPASIEVHRIKDGGPAIPSDLENSYRETIVLLPELVFRQTKWSWDHVFAQAAAAALVASRGQVDLADVILELGPSATKEFIEWWNG